MDWMDARGGDEGSRMAATDQLTINQAGVRDQQLISQGGALPSTLDWTGLPVHSTDVYSRSRYLQYMHTPSPASTLLVRQVQCETPERSALDDLGFGLAATALGNGALHRRRDQVDSLSDMRHATCFDQKAV